MGLTMQNTTKPTISKPPMTMTINAHVGSQFCDVATGLCNNIVDEGDDGLPTWALIVIVIGGLLIVGFVVFCIVKSLYKICCPNLCSDVAESLRLTEAEEEAKRPPVFRPIDRSKGRKEAEARYDVVLDTTHRFKDLMNDDSSDDDEFDDAQI